MQRERDRERGAEREREGDTDRKELAFMRFAAAAVARTQKRNKCGKRFIFGCFCLFTYPTPLPTATLQSGNFI